MVISYFQKISQKLFVPLRDLIFIIKRTKTIFIFFQKCRQFDVLIFQKWIKSHLCITCRYKNSIKIGILFLKVNVFFIKLKFTKKKNKNSNFYSKRLIHFIFSQSKILFMQNSRNTYYQQLNILKK